MRVAEFVLLSLVPGLKYRWRGSLKVHPAHNPQTPTFVFREIKTSVRALNSGPFLNYGVQ